MISHLERHPIACPYCWSQILESWCQGQMFYCSSCGSIYRHISSSSELERLNVDPIVNRSSYPEVIVEFTSQYCDCRLVDYFENPVVTSFGTRYCPKHNVIILEVFRQEDLEDVAKMTVLLINHETLHWILCRHLSESISLSLDRIQSIPPWF